MMTPQTDILVSPSVSDSGSIQTRRIAAGVRSIPQTRCPAVSRLLLRAFGTYTRWYLRRHFRSLRVTLTGQPPLNWDVPTVIYSNHAAWWDPLVALIIAHELFPSQRLYAPMDSVALERYQFFKRLGVFGVEQNTLRGSLTFLRTAEAILQSSSNILWLTPQSQFADARERPVQFRNGIGHLASRLKGVRFLPVAIEYTFWEEKLPEILIHFGQPFAVRIGDKRACPQAWTGLFAGQLAGAQDALADFAQRRDPSNFRCLLRGDSGVGGVYDFWRYLKATSRGKPFQRGHSRL